MESVSELFEKVLRKTTDELYCSLPCQVIAVGEGHKYVDVKVFVNDEEVDQILYNVPVQREETQRAYIFLGIKSGDRGTLKFFDRSTEAYLQSDFEYNSDERQHDINDRVFELGFLPNAEAFVYPSDQEIEIGLKNVKFRLSVDNDGNVDILSESDVTLNVTGDVTSTIQGDLTSIVNGNLISTIQGSSTTTVVGDVNLTAPTINTNGILNQVGAVNITGLVTVSNDVIANGISLKNHKHIGNLGDPTSAPIPQ